MKFLGFSGRIKPTSIKMKEIHQRTDYIPKFANLDNKELSKVESKIDKAYQNVLKKGWLPDEIVIYAKNKLIGAESLFVIENVSLNKQRAINVNILESINSVTPVSTLGVIKVNGVYHEVVRELDYSLYDLIELEVVQGSIYRRKCAKAVHLYDDGSLITCISDYLQHKKGEVIFERY